MLPSCLAWEDQVGMVHSKDRCEDQEEEEKDDEDHVDGLHVVTLPPNCINSHVRIIQYRLCVAIKS